MLLVTVTIAVAAILVLILAGYLIAITWALMQARRNVAELAKTLESIADATAGLPQAIEGTDAAVAAIGEVIPTAEPEAAEIATPAERHVSASNI